MIAYLPPHIHAARSGDDVVFFDARDGRYHLMAGLGRIAAMNAFTNVVDLDDAAAVETLEDAGLVVRAPTPARILAPPTPVSSALTGSTGPTTKTRRAIARAYIETAVLYPRRSLPFLLAHARGPARTDQADRTLELAHGFDRWSPLAADPGGCACSRCFMLMRLLSRAGAPDLQWIFGVRTWPFHAHCWVQQGAVVLSDYPEALVRYTPIFAA